jgi:anti-sigma28 factor (negative regulator of flagellin synthesis)
MADEPDPSTSIDLGALGHNLRKQAEGSPEREAHIERLRKLVQSGEYEVDSEALAQKLIDDHCADDAK